MVTLPCAVYTRKSSEEGLEQDFNSLDSQREACEAYILSQKTQGWKGVGSYDDGGFSGGNIQRPGLQRLLSDVTLGRIKVVVVYKVDRLTRSLADFAKLVELFDSQGVSFVSVTQQFNTTTSMGRLTLNVLLSFAQFEREVTGERIRDKIAASKRKGMWMGGFAPMGYIPYERTLAVDEPHAQRVREIFDLYLEVGSVRRLKAEMDARGWNTPQRQGKRSGGGRPFTHGHLYRLLSNPIYIGKIAHKGLIHPGQHQAIVSDEVWDATQRHIAKKTQGHSDRIHAEEPSLLAGLLQDSHGQVLRSTHTKKGNRRYRYYCTEISTGKPALRIPAHELENAVQAELLEFLQDHQRLIAAMPPLDATETKALFESAAEAVESLKQSRTTDRIKVLKQLVTQIRIFDASIEIGVLESGLAKASGTANERVHWISVPAQLKRGNRAMRLVLRDRVTAAKVPDPGLIALLARANRWFDALRKGHHGSIASLAQEQRQDGRDVTRTVYLAFLAPDIVDCIVRGEQPIGLGVRSLLAMAPLPMDWDAQRKLIGLT